MLQALTLENAPTPAKIRSGTGSDPADSVFAGLMTQASMASMTPAATNVAPSETTPREDPGSSREVSSQRADSPELRAASAPKERPSPEKTEAPDESRDPAKAAATPKPADTPTQEAGKEVTEPAKVELQATGPVQTSGQTPPPIAQPETQAVTSEVQDAKPGVQVVKPEPTPAQPPADPALKVPLAGLSQELLTAEENLPTKPALTELLSVPRADAPKPEPGAAKALPQEAPKLAITAATTGDPKAGTEFLGGETDPAKTSLNLPGVEERPKAEPFAPQLQNAKQAAPAIDTHTLAITEGAKAAQATIHAEAASAARPNPVFTQVEGSIRWILQNKTQGAELQLHPESLGRMVIQLRVEGQEVHARLWASEPTSLAILQDHKAFLESSLKEQGLNLGSFDLQSGARGQTAFQEQPSLPPAVKIALPEVKQEMPISLDPDPVEAHRIEVFA